MDRDTAVNLIKQKTGFRTSGESAIIAALQASQETLSFGGVMTEANYSTEVPWFLLVEAQTLDLTAGSNLVALPDDFIKEAEDTGPWFPNLVTGTGQPPVYLEKASPGFAQRTLLGTVSGPQVYEIRADEIWIYPAFDEDVTLYWSYYAKDVILDSNIENKWLKWVPSLLIGHAGQSYAADVRDKEAATEFSRLKLEGQKQLLTQNVQRQTANRRTSFGRYR